MKSNSLHISQTFQGEQHQHKHFVFHQKQLVGLIESGSWRSVESAYILYDLKGKPLAMNVSLDEMKKETVPKHTKMLLAAVRGKDNSHNLKHYQEIKKRKIKKLRSIRRSR